MQPQVERWRETQLGDERARLILYRAFVDSLLLQSSPSMMGLMHQRAIRTLE
jgi:hypothetical protein